MAVRTARIAVVRVVVVVAAGIPVVVVAADVRVVVGAVRVTVILPVVV
jgi:hypothetical protein